MRGEVDRVYLGVERPTIVEDTLWRRTIEVHHRGSRSLVLWNPHIEKAKRLSQFAPDAWRRMLCVETANVVDDAVHLEAGQLHSLGFRIAVRDTP